MLAASPQHPLAEIDKPLGKSELSHFKAIAISDTVRKMPRTVGLLFGQDTLTLPNMRTKYAFQLVGVGFGLLPEPPACDAIKKGLLLEKQVEETRPPEPHYLAWRSGEDGAALKWWIDKMHAPALMDKLWPSVI